jgi:hypothetical protein
VLVLDAGDLFLPPLNHAAGLLPPDAGEVERRARLVTAAFARIGTTAFTPGERDLAIGVPLLRRLLGAAKVPVVSANLVDRAGKRLFDADRLVDAAGVKVGIFGVSTPVPEDADAWKAWGVVAQDPVAAARAEVAALRARGAQLVVALLHLGALPDAKRLVREVPGIDWAVLGHSGMSLETPEQIGQARLLEAMTQGKQLGRLDLHLREGGTTFTDRGERAQLETILADHQRQVEDYRKRVGDAKEASMKDYYNQRLVDLQKSITRETTLLAALPSQVKGNWFENRIMPLDTSVPDQAGVAMLVAAYNQENQRRAAAGKPVGLAGRDPHAPAPVAHAPAAPPAAVDASMTYAGTVACGSCHQPALKFWQTTKHARALEALAKTHRDRDPTCVGCHVTGYLRPGGTADIAVATARLREVGCEACHGPGMAHLTALDTPAKKATTSRKVAASVCLGCHTPDQTNGDFDYPRFLKAVLGPGHGG